MINWVERQQETTLSFPRSHGLSQDIKKTENVETHDHLLTENRFTRTTMPNAQLANFGKSEVCSSCGRRRFRMKRGALKKKEIKIKGGKLLLHGDESNFHHLYS